MEKLFYHGKGGGGHQIFGLQSPSEGQEEKVGGVSDLIKACPLSLVVDLTLKVGLLLLRYYSKELTDQGVRHVKIPTHAVPL